MSAKSSKRVLGVREKVKVAIVAIYNSLIFFGPDGMMLGRHRKSMPTFTKRMFLGQGRDIHLAVVPGALDELEKAGGSCGHVEERAHDLEAGAFVVSGYAVLNEAVAR